jgi:hypothetical protein
MLLQEGLSLYARIQSGELQHNLSNKFANVVRATIKGNIVIAIVQGILGGLILWILAIEGAVMPAVKLRLPAKPWTPGSIPTPASNSKIKQLARCSSSVGAGLGESTFAKNASSLRAPGPANPCSSSCKTRPIVTMVSAPSSAYRTRALSAQCIDPTTRALARACVAGGALERLPCARKARCACGKPTSPAYDFHGSDDREHRAAEHRGKTP